MARRDYFWMIEQTVGNGYYITLPGIYETKEGAEAAFPSGGNLRAMEYCTGRGNGPIRVGSPLYEQLYG